jgi:hypothetical protein
MATKEGKRCNAMRQGQKKKRDAANKRVGFDIGEVVLVVEDLRS